MFSADGEFVEFTQSVSLEKPVEVLREPWPLVGHVCSEITYSRGALTQWFDFRGKCLCVCRTCVCACVRVRVCVCVRAYVSSAGCVTLSGPCAPRSRTP